LTSYVDINIIHRMATRKAPSLATTHAVRDLCLCLHVQRAARVLARHYDEALRPVGLTNGQFSLMMALNRPKPPTIGDVSSLLAMDRTTLTANLKPLQRRGLVELLVNDADRRSRFLKLSRAGRQKLTAAMPLWRKAQRATEQSIGGADPDRLRAELRALS
jgi:DNA-binding MarR family transcriptional regulator